jgi:8-oxo-dGTP diphosphatase
MANKDGDGWLQCGCGNRHWGLHGAAGLLLVRDGTILLQHRAPWVHNGDTWGIPGGAKDSHETILEGAKREAREELGIDTDLITPIHTFTDDHGVWRYDTIICLASPDLIAHEMNDESQEIRWVPFADVEKMHLHPSFARHWPELQTLLGELLI